MKLGDFRYPGESVTRSPPANLAPGDEHLFLNDRTRIFGAVRAVQRERVRVHADGVCLRRAGSLFLPTLVFPEQTLSLPHAVKATLLLSRSVIRGMQGLVGREYSSGLLLTDLYFGGFFHWLGDVMPKVTALVEAGVDLTRERLLLPASRDAGYVGEILAAYGLRAQVIRPLEYAAVEQLTFVPRLTPSGNFRPAVMRRLAEAVRAHVGAGAGTARTYITRRRAAKRRLLNEEDILPLLERHGFRIVSMEDLSFTEQVRTAAGSAVIAGLHGAGLTHMLWMRAGGQVLEIRGAGDRSNNCYYGLASDLGHAYYYSLSRKRSQFATTQSADFIADVECFERALNQMS